MLDTTDVEGAMFALLCWSTVSLSYTISLQASHFSGSGTGVLPPAYKD